MGALAGALKFKLAAPFNYLKPVVQVNAQRLFEVEHAGLAIYQRQHNQAEGNTHGGVLIERLQHLLRVGRLGQLNDHAHALTVGFIPQVGDAFNLLVPRKGSDALQQRGLVHHVGDLCDHNAVAAAAHLFDVGARLHLNSPPAATIGLLQSALLNAINHNAASGEIGAFDETHQLLNADVVNPFPVLQHVHQGVNHLPQVVRRDAGRHPHGDAGDAVDQQIGQRCGQHIRLAEGIIKIGGKIHRVLVNIRQHVRRQRRHARLGVAHRRRGIPIHAAEVALPIHKLVAHGKILRHARHGVINRHIAVRVVFPQHLTDDARRLLVGRIRAQSHIVHGVEDAPVDRFQTVARVGQGARDDHTHRIVQIGLLHLLINIYSANQANFHWKLQMLKRNICAKNYNMGADGPCIKKSPLSKILREGIFLPEGVLPYSITRSASSSSPSVATTSSTAPATGSSSTVSACCFPNEPNGPISKPVPAGISLPMMTFSFKP